MSNYRPEAGEEPALTCSKIMYGQQQLTPEQEAYARRFAQERIAAQLSPATIDESEAEHHLRQAYQEAGLELVPVRWFDSPRAFVVADVDSAWAGVPVVQDASAWERLRVSVDASVWGHMGKSVRDYVEDSKINSVWDHIEASVWDYIGDQVRNHVGVGMRAGVGASVEASEMWAKVDSMKMRDRAWGIRVQAAMQESVRVSVRAYYDEGWHSFYRFFHEVVEKNALIHLALFNELVSGYRLGSNRAWLVHKPIRLQLDEQGRLHSQQGMCLEYRDGWGFYAWHGVWVPEKIILHPEQITRQDWLTEHNVEIRRIMQERLGQERFFQRMGAICIDQGQRGTLVEVDLGDDPERLARFVQVKDSSTERRYTLRVPPWIKRADEAVAWTFGLEEADCQPQQEA